MLIKLLLTITQITAGLPFSEIYVKTPYLFQIIVYYVVIFGYITLQKGNKMRIFCKYKKQIITIILIITILPAVFDIAPKNSLKVNFVDVGQGDCTLIITPQNKKILIDGGGSEDYDIRRKYSYSISLK